MILGTCKSGKNSVVNYFSLLTSFKIGLYFQFRILTEKFLEGFKPYPEIFLISKYVKTFFLIFNLQTLFTWVFLVTLRQHRREKRMKQKKVKAEAGEMMLTNLARPLVQALRKRGISSSMSLYICRLSRGLYFWILEHYT